MTHDEIVTEVQRRARARGLLSHYCRRSALCSGDRGLPDLIVAGGYGVAYVEVKTPGDRLKPDQVRWRHMLLAAGQLYEVMGAGDLAAGGAVDMLLSFVASGDVAA